jgi:putative heme uptake system protein
MGTGTLLVWDAPNMDMTLGTLLGGTRPNPAQRPRFDAVGRWLLDLAPDPTRVEAVVFTNIAPGAAQFVRGWIEAVRSVGFAVFAKPKIEPDDDVDDEMRAHIEQRSTEDWLGTLVVASADGRNFREQLERLAGEGVDARVLAFEEHAGYATNSRSITFVDLEDVPGAFSAPLPRFRLDKLPPGGLLLPPTRPLLALRGAVLAGEERDRDVPADEPAAAG